MPAPTDATWLETVPAAGAPKGRTCASRRSAVRRSMFSPYYRAGGRRDRTWRLTWMPLAPESQ